MKKYLIFSLFVMCFGQFVNAQVGQINIQGIPTQAYLNPVLINPGAMGVLDQQKFLLNYRSAWTGIDDAPRTGWLNYDGSFGNNLGLGAQLIYDSFGAFETLKGAIGGAYHLQLKENHLLSFGINAEYIQFQLDDPSGMPIIDPNDPEIAARLDGSKFFQVTLGAFGVYNDQIIYGLSFPSLLRSGLNELATGAQNDNEFSVIGQLGVRLPVEEYDMVIEPSLIVKTLNNTPTMVDINLKADFMDDQFTGGLTYSAGGDNRFGFLAGARVDNLRFYYSYNFSFNDFQRYNQGSHELTLQYSLGKVFEKKQSKTREKEEMEEEF